MVSAFILSFFLGGGYCLSQAWQTDWSMLAATVSVAVAGWPVTRATSCDATSSLAHYWLLLGVWRRASRCVLCLSCRRALRALRALLSTTARSFRIVGKLRGNLFIADQSRAASHAPSHFTLLAPRILPWPRDRAVAPVPPCPCQRRAANTRRHWTRTVLVGICDYYSVVVHTGKAVQIQNRMCINLERTDNSTYCYITNLISLHRNMCIDINDYLK